MSREFIDEERLRRYFNEKNHEDEKLIEKVFTDDAKKLQLKKILEKQFEEFTDENDQNTKNLDHIFYRIYYDITSKKSSGRTVKFQNFVKWTYRAAGIILLPLAIFMGIYLYKTQSSINDYWVEIKAPAWTRAQFSLPDGTTGWLNSNSGIRYKGDFTDERTVSLTGEVFFDVAENPRKAFIVKTGDVSVKVLGTKFNVASYENENDVEVVLEEGKLEFSNTTDNSTYTMKPGDLVIYDKATNEYAISEVQTNKYTSWKEGKLIFRNDPIDVIARRLARWYNVEVVTNIFSSADIRWRATFEDEDLEKVLDIMKRTLPVNYKIEEPGVNQQDIYSKKKITITLKN